MAVAACRAAQQGALGRSHCTYGVSSASRPAGLWLSARRRFSSSPQSPPGDGGASAVGNETGILEQAMRKLSDGKELLTSGKTVQGAQMMEEAISMLHGGLSPDALASDADAAGGARGASEWAVIPERLTIEVLAEARFLAGTAAQKEGKWERALNHFQSAMRDCPAVVDHIPAFLYGVATSQAVLGELEAALRNFKMYEKAIKQGNFVFNPTQDMLLSFNIGQTLVRMQRDDEAVAAFQAVFAKGAEFAEKHRPEGEKSERRGTVIAAHYWTAVAAGALGRHQEVVAHLESFEAAVAAGMCDESLLETGWQERYRARLIRGLLRSDPRKHMQTAVSHATVLCQVAPENPMYRRVLADCLFNSGDLNAAAAAFRFLLDMPHSPAQRDINVLLNYARCLHDLGDLDGSHAYFTQVLAQQPSHADAMLGVAAVGIAQLRSSTLVSPPSASVSFTSVVETCASTTRAVSSSSVPAGNVCGGGGGSDVSLRTPREEWMERQLQRGGVGGVEGGLATGVLDALSSLRAVLKKRSNVEAMFLRSEALVRLPLRRTFTSHRPITLLTCTVSIVCVSSNYKD